jgi:hypothetical protein
MNQFEVKKQISPIQAAKLEKEKRQRASGSSNKRLTTTDW